MTQLLDEVCHAVKTLPGWCSEEKAVKMVELILAMQPQRCVEIGVFGGRSLIPQALALKEVHMGGGKPGRIIGIDPWLKVESLDGVAEEENREWWGQVEHEGLYQSTLQKIHVYGVGPYVSILRESSASARIGFKGRIDWLHIDGNHSPEKALADVETWVPLVNEGGAVWFDDVDWEQTQTALRKLPEFCDYLLQVSNCQLWRRRCPVASPAVIG